MDVSAQTIIANADRILAEQDCYDTCGFECRGWCRPSIRFVLRNVLASTQEDLPIQIPITAPHASTEPDTTAIPIVVFTPEQLYLGGDPALGFRPRTTGRPGTTSWDGLVRLLSRATEGDPTKHANLDVQKAARGGWSACALRGGRRLASEFVETMLLVLDIDDHGDIERALKAFEPFKKIVHGTYKTTVDRPRCRVIFQLKDPCRDAETFRQGHRTVRQAAVRGGWFKEEDFDDAGSDPSRLWFLPMVRPGVEYAFHVTDGEPLDLNRLAPRATMTCRPSVRKTTKGTNPSGALAWAERKMRGASEGQRHKTVFSLAAWLAEIDPVIPEHEIEAMLVAFAPKGREAEFSRTIADGIRRGRAA